MPVYDYDCAACGRRFEIIHGVHADGPTTCPLCGKGPVRKAISAPAIHYKGSGWAKKERRATATPGGSAAPTDAASSDDKGSKSGDDGGSKSDDQSSAAKDAAPSTKASTSKKVPETGTAGSKD